MSLDKLAEESGINVPTIKKYECSIRNPKPDQIQKIATALGIHINIFIPNYMDSLSDIIFLLIYDANSITLTFSDEQIKSYTAVPNTFITISINVMSEFLVFISLKCDD